MMARAARPLPDGSEWVGRRVKYSPRHHQRPEFGVVVRMATGKALAMFVSFDDGGDAKLCYASDLQVVE